MRRVLQVSTLIAIAVALIVLTESYICSASDLLSYVNKPDESFGWKKVNENKEMLGTKTTLSMTSQTWQGIVWKHTIELYTPESCTFPKTAMVIVTGGGPGKESSILGQLLSNAAKCPVAILFNIPNQPLFEGKREDALIAYTFQKAMETGDMSWPLLLPMTKSTVKAMDAIQAYSKVSMKVPIENFVVGGASKRGWTTWLTAAADPVRVKGIVPIVYDNLNLEKQMQLQVDTYGAYSSQINDYTEIKLQDKLKTKEGKELARTVDPWSYRDCINMPKLIINGTNDEYWTLGSLNVYWNDLQGEKAVLYVPNAGHGTVIGSPDIVNLTRAMVSITAFVKTIAAGKNLPELKWNYTCKGKKCRLDVKTDAKQSNAKLWMATSNSRDFRKSVWKSVDMNLRSGEFSKAVAFPSDGYKAVYGEMTFTGGDSDYSLCTQVQILDCNGAVNTDK